MNGEDSTVQQAQTLSSDNVQTSDISPQPSEQNEQKTKSPVSYLPFLLILLMLLGGLFYYGLQLQKDDTPQLSTAAPAKTKESKQTTTANLQKKGWKTYTDEKKRFTFLYPSTWEVRNTIYTTAGELPTYQAAFVNEKDTNKYGKGIIVSVYPGLGNLTIEEFLKTKWYVPPEFASDVAAAFVSNMRTVPATEDFPFEQCEELYLKNGVAGYAVWKRNGNDGIFIIARNMVYSSSPPQEDEFHQILSSFTSL